MGVNQKLRIAASFGDTESVLRCLSQKNWGPLVQHDKRLSAVVCALMCAIINGHEDCVKLLLPHSDVMAVNDDGLTACQLARHHGYPGLADMINVYMAQREASLISDHVSSGPTQEPKRRAPRQRI